MGRFTRGAAGIDALGAPLANDVADAGDSNRTLARRPFVNAILMRNTAAHRALPLNAEELRRRFVRAAGDLTVHLRLAENSIGRLRAAVEYASRAVTELKSLGLTGVAADEWRRVTRRATLTALEAQGLELDLNRARAAAHAHREDVERFFREHDGRPAGPEFALRLRLLARRPQAPVELAYLARTACERADEIVRLRELIDQRTHAVRDALVDVVAELSSLAVAFAARRGDR
jgi:hypothetical protein